MVHLIGSNSSHQQEVLVASMLVLNCDLTTTEWKSQENSQSLQSKLGFELILIFCSRFLVMKLVRSPSWLTVPSSSRAEEMVALRPSDWPLLPPARLPDTTRHSLLEQRLQESEELKTTSLIQRSLHFREWLH